jgi:hypothetical protein
MGKESRLACLHRDPKKFKARIMADSARKRAVKFKVPMNIDAEYILSLCIDECPALGLNLDYVATGQKHNSPSLDRIYPDRGYVKGNVFVISRLANVMKNCGTLEQIVLLAKWVSKLAHLIDKDDRVKLAAILTEAAANLNEPSSSAPPLAEAAD